jgi:hypothetical protein
MYEQCVLFYLYNFYSKAGLKLFLLQEFEQQWLSGIHYWSQWPHKLGVSVSTLNCDSVFFFGQCCLGLRVWVLYFCTLLLLLLPLLQQIACCPFCYWHRVLTYAAIGICRDLSNNQLSGTLDPLSSLNNLKYLYVPLNPFIIPFIYHRSWEP